LRKDQTELRPIQDFVARSVRLIGSSSFSPGWFSLRQKRQSFLTAVPKRGARQAIVRTEASPIITQLVDAAENTIDELEQAAFCASPPLGLR
jgi:hypothetical protein